MVLLLAVASVTCVATIVSVARCVKLNNVTSGVFRLDSG